MPITGAGPGTRSFTALILLPLSAVLGISITRCTRGQRAPALYSSSFVSRITSLEWLAYEISSMYCRGIHISQPVRGFTILISAHDRRASIHSFGSASLIAGQNEKRRCPIWSSGDGNNGANIRLSVTPDLYCPCDALD